ncbi:MAG: M1 family aminopeptidase [Desulfuromonadaceae bacterium]|nr:M1 family aminopeptidase [Desulfuromonadaceae bacterium]MDD5104566.1 M1 family aminopeptidase [Desulfuromonadaceae bacterium]
MNKLILTVILFFAFACRSDALPSGQDQDHSVIVNQEIAVTLLPAEHLLTGVSSITYSAGTHRAVLKLSTAATITAVTTAGVQCQFSFTDGILSLTVPQLSEDAAVTVTIRYNAHFSDPLPQRPGSSEDPTYGVTGTITAQGTFLTAEAGWYPAPAASPHQRTITITAPAGIEAVTAGRRVSRQTKGKMSRSVWEESNPVGNLTLCAGPYLIKESRSDDVPIYTYFYPQNAALADRYLVAAARYLNIYKGLFGPYPFEKFAVVENIFPTGYALPSFTLLGSSIIRLPFIIDTSLPHEIAHSWWGNAVQVDQNEGNWAEGLVTYLADYLLKERHSTDEARHYRLQLLSDYATLVSPGSDFPLSRFTSRVDPPSRAIGYGKSAMVFHMIRTEIGDRAFFGALQDVFRAQRYQSAAWSDFERAFSRNSGRDLSPFITQWLKRPGGAHPALSQVSRQRTEKGWAVSGTIVQTHPLYKLRVPLRLETDGAALQESLPISREQTPFSIITSAEPQRLLLDPDAELFRALDPGETPATVNSIKGSQRLVAVATKECRATVDTLRQLLESLGQRNAPLLSEEEYASVQNQDHDVLLCGTPQQKSLLPQLPAGISIDDPRFSVNGATAEAPDGLLFLTLPFPGSSGRVAALFQPLSEAAAANYAPKITHYGTFSALMFSGGAIRHKSTRAPLTGVNSFRFTGEK